MTGQEVYDKIKSESIRYPLVYNKGGKLHEKIKKIFAITAALAVLASFGNTAAVAAGNTCPPHGPYEDRLLDVSQSYREHDVLKTDENGYYLYDPITQELVKETCVVTQSRYYRGVYCTGCWRLIYDYRYEDPECHSCSYCPERGN